ncbi:MAG: LysM peptidoglycan-binding domain-containing protein [Negativicutes bacterium]|nr:LysM peptidoglycan-binding domain-containing protein [Negativicutes bacterium]
MEFDASVIKANNSYIESKAFIEVRVQPGESVWSIASRYVTDKDDVRELIMAIRQRNELSANAEIFAGQTLKVPMKAHNHSNTIVSAAAKTGN